MGTVKVWTTPQSYTMITESKTPDQYWLTKPNIENVVELTMPIETVQKWNEKVSKKNKHLMFG